jgi:D-glycero-D-manno-heptose 1,7-bisphosphate phosphatase
MPDKYIVLDRDGVINVDLFDYVLKNETFEFEKGSIEALIKLSKNNYQIIVATNQKCINLGLISAEGIEKINNFWINKIKELGGDILHIEVCPHKDEENCNCRKPKTGLLIAAFLVFVWTNFNVKNIAAKFFYFINPKIINFFYSLSRN